MIRVPTAPAAHLVFDLLAWGGGLAFGMVLYRWRLRPIAERVASRVGGGYFLALPGVRDTSDWYGRTLLT